MFLSQEAAGPILDNIDHLYSDLRKVFERGQRKGTIRGANAALMAHLFTALVGEFAQFELRDRTTRASTTTELDDLITRSFINP